jgi:hypothetical protein
MTHWQRGHRSKDRKPLSQILAERESRRVASIVAAVEAVKSSQDPSDISYESIADLTGLPLGFLRWKYPTIDSLTSVTVP